MVSIKTVLNCPFKFVDDNTDKLTHLAEQTVKLENTEIKSEPLDMCLNSEEESYEDNYVLDAEKIKMGMPKMLDNIVENRGSESREQVRKKPQNKRQTLKKQSKGKQVRKSKDVDSDNKEFLDNVGNEGEDVRSELKSEHAEGLETEEDKQEQYAQSKD